MNRYLSVKQLASLHKKSAEHIRAIISRNKIRATHSIKQRIKDHTLARNAMYDSIREIKIYDALVVDAVLNKRDVAL